MRRCAGVVTKGGISLIPGRVLLQGEDARRRRPKRDRPAGVGGGKRRMLKKQHLKLTSEEMLIFQHLMKPRKAAPTVPSFIFP